MAPEPTKIKLSNYMKVLGNESFIDPTGTRLKVEKIVQKRQEDHLMRNERNKLTRDKKEAKMKRKHDRDIQNECRIALFKIDRSLQVPQHKFKVDKNA